MVKFGPDLIDKIIVLSVIILLTIAIARLFQSFIQFQLVRRNVVSLKDPTRLKFFGHLGQALIYILGTSFAVSQFSSLKPIANSMLAGAGILTVAIGFASQNALSNIISGLFVVIFKPFRVNDRLLIKDQVQGVVEDITLRHTVIRDGQNRRIIVPNSVANSEILINYNYAGEALLRATNIIVTHDSNINNVRSLINEIVSAHPLYKDLRSEKEIELGTHPVSVNVTQIDEMGIHLSLYINTYNIADAGTITYHLLEQLISQMPEHGGYFVQRADIQHAANQNKKDASL